MAGRGGRCSWGAPGRAPWSKTRAVPRQMRAASKRERGQVAPRYPPRPRAPDGPPSPSAAGRAVQRRRRGPMSTRAARPPPGATAFPGGANACTRTRSQPGRTVRRGHERVATRRPPGCTHRIGTTPRAILHRTGDPRVPCAAVEWHGLMVRYGHGSATAIGALGRRSPGQPVAAQSSPGARRTQQADVVRDLRAVWATTVPPCFFYLVLERSHEKPRKNVPP